MKFILLILLIGNAFGYSHKSGPMVVGDKKEPEVSAVLEVASKAKGFLPPRMTQVERDAIASPTAGLEIYNSDINSPEFYNGVTWVQSGGTGTSFQFTATAHGRTVGCPLSPIYFDGTNWADARADAVSTLATHVITKVIDSNNIEISQSGRFSCNAHGLTIGAHYYTGVTGGLSTTPAESYNNPVLFVENANIVHIVPYRASSTAATTVGQVDTVYGRTGNVVATLGDYGANLITNTPTGNIAATDVQAAINELDSEIQAIDVSSKANTSTQIISGEGLQGGGDLTSDRSLGLDIDGLTSQAISLSDTLVYFDGTNHRKNTIASLLGLATLDSISDVSTAGAVNGDILQYNGTSWEVGNKAATAIDVAAFNDGIADTNTDPNNDAILSVDIPSLDRETPAKLNTDMMAFSVSTNKLVKVSVGNIVEAVNVNAGITRERQTINLVADTPLVITSLSLQDVYLLQTYLSTGEKIELEVVKTSATTFTLESGIPYSDVEVNMMGQAL